jgi:putative ATP-dependent endonuclease of the OLD family
VSVTCPSRRRSRTGEWLYRLIHRLADRGNQIFFTTHAPGLLNVAALEEVNLVSRDRLGVTTIEQLRPIDVDATFRVLCEFDAARAELFFSRAAILVEGMTEKMAFPFVFHALGHDPDREQISIVECGGKANLPLFVEICRRARIPYVVVHDSDRRPDREPAESELRLNALIRHTAGARRTIVLEPDFEGVAGFHSRTHKPERAWSRLGQARHDELPYRSSAPSGSRSPRSARAYRPTARPSARDPARWMGDRRVTSSPARTEARRVRRPRRTRSCRRTA